MSSTAGPVSNNTGFASFEKELICSICTEVLYQPLTILNCLHTFCGSCLKEWFSHQNRKASSSRATTSSTNPYSCPTCRAEVIDVQHNATVSNLLELFLAANPTRDRTQDEKDDMDKLYKPDGTRPRDKILPKVERRRERRTRREDGHVARDQRMVEEARQRSVADLDLAPSSATLLPPPSTDRARSASNEREERRQRRRDRERHRETTSSTSLPQRRNADHSPPSSSPRHPDAIELRQREHRMSHQASLRSMVSVSDTTGSGTGTGDSIDEARIMQEIIDEGLLGDIDVDALTEEEQDRLAERIAELYRQRHSRQSNTNASSPTPSSQATGILDTARVQPVHNDEFRQYQSSSGHRSTLDVAVSPEARVRSNSARPPQMPPTSIARSNSQGSSSVTFHHRRRRSEQARYDQPRNRSRQSSQERNTSVSSSIYNLHLDNGRDQRPSHSQGRTNTDPVVSNPRASQTWSQMGADTSKSQQRRSTTPTGRHDSMPHLTTTRDSDIKLAELNGKSLPELVTFEEPDISCFRCQRSDLTYILHRHCALCDVDLCLRCYRSGQGCKHWLGFGHAADTEYERRKEKGEKLLPSHFLIGRKYTSPPDTSVIARRTTTDIPTAASNMTSSNPNDRLLEGWFCDRCFTFSNTQYWLCDVCNEGEWGFCRQCVQTHHCCTHRLLALAYQPTTRIERSDNEITADSRLAITNEPRTTSSIASHSRIGSGYDYLSINVNCDMCHDIIFPSSPRYHCPFHFTDYDICSSCYASYLAHLRMRRDPSAELTAGWRKCPSGHRMIVLAFEGGMQDDGTIDSDDGVRRVVKANLVGGWKMTEQDQSIWNHQHGLHVGTSSVAPSTARGKWSWKEDVAGTKRTRNRTSTLSENRFPPDGGIGQRATVGRYGYWPEDGPDGEGELHLPISAEITEIEDINGDWWDGVYAGDIGVLPSNHVTVHR